MKQATHRSPNAARPTGGRAPAEPQFLPSAAKLFPREERARWQSIRLARRTRRRIAGGEAEGRPTSRREAAGLPRPGGAQEMADFPAAYPPRPDTGRRVLQLRGNPRSCA